MRLVCILSPFSGDRLLNDRYLHACLRDSFARGEAPYASHAIGPLVLDDNDPAQRKAGCAAGIAWMLRAERVAVYADLGLSRGMRAELEAIAGLPEGAPCPVVERRLLGADWYARLADRVTTPRVAPVLAEADALIGARVHLADRRCVCSVARGECPLHGEGDAA